MPPFAGDRPNPARDVAVAALAAATFLAAPILLPQSLEFSTYLFGVAAALVCAATAGARSVMMASAIVIAAGLILDRRAGIPPPELYVRSGIFLLVAGTVAYWAQALRRYQKRAIDAINSAARKEAVLRSILDTGPDAIVVIDRQARVSIFNLGAERMFGWSADEVIGQNINMLMPAPYRDEHDGYLQHYRATGERRVMGKSREVTGLRKDGSRFPMMLHVGEIRIGAEQHFTGFVQDMSAMHEAQDRTQELRRQLTYVWRMNSLGEMAAMLAHELNQPLTAISNYVRGARTIVNRLELDDEDLLDALEKAGEQAIRAGEIIRRTRGMVAREGVEHLPESLRDLIMEIEPMTTLVAREGAVTVKYAFEAGPDFVRVDRIQIQQVIGNLLRNAVDAMRDAPFRIVEIVTERAPTGWVVRVNDSGPGLAPEIANQLFTPMLTTKQGGMGLGLSISRTIIENHGGAIWVERSRLGGASFCFSLRDGESK